MSKRGITLADLAPAAREQATRAVSRDLARGNGSTVKPTLEPGCRAYGCTAPHPTPTIIGTWFRIGARGTQIFPVEVTATGKDWLDVVTPTGAIQRTRTDGADSYHATLAEAEAAVYAHLQRARERAVGELTQFEGKIGAAAYARARERYNAATRALDDHPLRSR